MSGGDDDFCDDFCGEFFYEFCGCLRCLRRLAPPDPRAHHVECPFAFSTDAETQPSCNQIVYTPSEMDTCKERSEAPSVQSGRLPQEEIRRTNAKRPRRAPEPPRCSRQAASTAARSEEPGSGAPEDSPVSAASAARRAERLARRPSLG